MEAKLKLTVAQLKQLKKEEYILIDIRNQEAYHHGFIPEAINIPKTHHTNGYALRCTGTNHDAKAP